MREEGQGRYDSSFCDKVWKKEKKTAFLEPHLSLSSQSGHHLMLLFICSSWISNKERLNWISSKGKRGCFCNVLYKKGLDIDFFGGLASGYALKSRSAIAKIPLRQNRRFNPSLRLRRRGKEEALFALSISLQRSVTLPPKKVPWKRESWTHRDPPSLSWVPERERKKCEQLEGEPDTHAMCDEGTPFFGRSLPSFLSRPGFFSVGN